MIPSTNNLKRPARLVFDMMLGMFMLSMFLIASLPRHNEPSSTEPLAASNLVGMQGTTVLTITGSISPTDPTFTGQRHFRSNIRGDRNCVPFGENGPRFYDEAVFFNSASTAQRVSISFTSGCASNTFMAAYNPQFNPNDLCANFVASAGVSGSVTWSFIVCASSQFSIIVYGLEPLVTCSSYSYTVTGVGLIQLGGNSETKAPATSDDAWQFPVSDVAIKRVAPDDSIDSEVRINVPDNFKPSPLPNRLTSVVVTINDSIDGTEPTLFGQRHVRTGLPGDPNCLVTGTFGQRFYDEVFFMNNSASTQRVTIAFASSCGSNTYMAAYAPQFNPFSICTNYIAGAGIAGNVTWDFTVCPNTQFSIVVYGADPGLLCFSYSYTVIADGVVHLGTLADLSITKSAPLGPVSAGTILPYTMIIRNNGPRRANGITFTDVLPPSTTFSSIALISDSGTPLPTSLCTTPPIGSNGTVTCSGFSLNPGFANFLAVLLSVNVSPRSSPVISNTATVTHTGFDANLANNSATATTLVTGIFDLCLQDDADPSKVLFVNSSTGDYRFCCSGTVISGRGQVTIRGSIYTLEDNSTGRRVLARDDEGVHKGTATLQMPPGVVNCGIADRNTLNNSCTCP